MEITIVLPEWMGAISPAGWMWIGGVAGGLLWYAFAAVLIRMGHDADAPDDAGRCLVWAFSPVILPVAMVLGAGEWFAKHVLRGKN